MQNLPFTALVMIHLSLIVCAAPATADDLDKTLRNQPLTRISQLEKGLLGIAKPAKLVKLKSNVSGPIAAIAIQEGQQVSEGEVLVQFDSRLAESRLRIARSLAEQRGTLNQAKVEWELEEQRLQRLKSIVNLDVTSQLELEEKTAIRDQKKAIWEAATEEVNLANRQLELATIELQQHTLRAPFSGTVTELSLQVGETPDVGQAVLSVADLSELKAEIHVPLSRFGQVRPGDSIRLRAHAPIKRTLTATVHHVSPIINSTSQTFRCVVMIQNHDLQLPAGFLVSLETE